MTRLGRVRPLRMKPTIFARSIRGSEQADRTTAVSAASPSARAVFPSLGTLAHSCPLRVMTRMPEARASSCTTLGRPRPAGRPASQ